MIGIGEHEAFQRRAGRDICPFGEFLGERRAFIDQGQKISALKSEEAVPVDQLRQFFNARPFQCAEGDEALAGVRQDFGDLSNRLRLIEEVDARFESPVVAFQPRVIQEQVGIANETGVGERPGNGAGAGSEWNMKSKGLRHAAGGRVQF